MGGNRGVSKWVREHALAYQSRPQCIADCAATIGCTRKVAGAAIKLGFPQHVFQEESRRGRPRKSKTGVASPPQGKASPAGTPAIGCDVDVNDLRKLHNPLLRLRDGCKQLKGYSRKKLFLERAFCDRFVHIPFARFKQVVYDNGAHTEFQEFHGKAGGGVYWAHPDTIAQCKSEGWMKG